MAASSLLRALLLAAVALLALAETAATAAPYGLYLAPEKPTGERVALQFLELVKDPETDLLGRDLHGDPLELENLDPSSYNPRTLAWLGELRNLTQTSLRVNESNVFDHIYVGLVLPAGDLQVDLWISPPEGSRLQPKLLANNLRLLAKDPSSSFNQAAILRLGGPASLREPLPGTGKGDRMTRVSPAGVFFAFLVIGCAAVGLTLAGRFYDQQSNSPLLGWAVVSVIGWIINLAMLDDMAGIGGLKSARDAGIAFLVLGMVGGGGFVLLVFSGEKSTNPKWVDWAASNTFVMWFAAALGFLNPGLARLVCSGVFQKAAFGAQISEHADKRLRTAGILSLVLVAFPLFAVQARALSQQGSSHNVAMIGLLLSLCGFVFGGLSLARPPMVLDDSEDVDEDEDLDYAHASTEI